MPYLFTLKPFKRNPKYVSTLFVEPLVQSLCFNSTGKVQVFVVKET